MSDIHYRSASTPPNDNLGCLGMKLELETIWIICSAPYDPMVAYYMLIEVGSEEAHVLLLEDYQMN